MKSDIALHEIMRLDEYAQEEAEAKAEAEANSTLSQSVVKDNESIDTSLKDAPAMHESVSSIDIPSETVINYDEPPAMADEPEMKIDEEAATKSVDIVTTEPAIDPGESLTDPEDMPKMEDVKKAVDSTTDSVKETVMDAVEAVDSKTDSAKETVINAVESTTDAAQETWDTVRAKAPGAFDEVLSAIPAFFQNNRQLLINLGVVFLAFVAAKLLFAGLDAIDDLPLVTPLLKTVGLVSVVKFIWDYLLREQDRQKLAEKFDRIKAEVLGNPQ